MELREYLRILHKNWVLIVVMALLGLGSGAVVSLLATPKYEAHTQLFVSVRSDAAGTGELVQGTNFARQIVTSYVDVIRTGVVLDPVVEQLQLDMTSAELAEHVASSSPINSVLINISATSPSSEQAALIANTVGESFKEVVRTQLDPETDAAGGLVTLTTTQVASKPAAPVSPRPPINLVLGLLLGLTTGFGVALLLNLLDTRIHSLHDIEQITDKPLLGGIIDDPEAPKKPLIVHAEPHSPRAESFRALRTNLQFLHFSSENRAFVITSPGPGEGKSTTSVNLALSLTMAGSQVALVEADLRLPKASSYLGIDGAAGLTDVLIGAADLHDVLQPWGRGGLHVLPAGRIPPNPSELLGSVEMEDTLRALTNTFDYVIIDAPPVLAVTDAAVIGNMAAGVLSVVASGSTRKQSFASAIRALETAGTDVLGVIVTMLATKGPDRYGYGGYGSGYGSYGELAKDVAPSAEPKGSSRKERRRERRAS